jgi:hypothetical protein
MKKQSKKQLTEVEATKLDQEIQQGWIILNKMKQLLKLKGYDKSSRASK